MFEIMFYFIPFHLTDKKLSVIYKILTGLSISGIETISRPVFSVSSTCTE
jgi:multidrug transporter EmrE-like cation transporter